MTTNWRDIADQLGPPFGIDFMERVESSWYEQRFTSEAEMDRNLYQLARMMAANNLYCNVFHEEVEAQRNEIAAMIAGDDQ